MNFGIDDTTCHKKSRRPNQSVAAMHNPSIAGSVDRMIAPHFPVGDVQLSTATHPVNDLDKADAALRVQRSVDLDDINRRAHRPGRKNRDEC